MTVQTQTATRPLYTIAAEIIRHWRPMPVAARPYVAAMQALDKITDSYGYDSGKSVVLYFLSNASTWRGEDARRIKAELKKMVGIK